MWKNARQQMIMELANGFAEINMYDREMQAWDREVRNYYSLWCPSRSVPNLKPKPQLGSFRATATPADERHASDLWETAFKAGHQKMTDFKADIESHVLTGGMAHSTWLQNVRKNIVQRQLESLL